MTIELRHLRLVRAIADHGTMTRAARVLNVSQSALSHQLRQVEEQLGARLFSRIGRRMTLTVAGERLLDTSRRVLPEVESAETEIQGIRAGHRGTLRISTQCITAYHWLPPRIRIFRQRLPDIEVEVDVDATPDPVRSLVEGRLDVAIAHTIAPVPDLWELSLFTDEIVALMQPGSSLAGRAFLDAGDLEGSHLIMYPVPTESTLLFRQVLTPAGVAPARISRLRLTEAILEMAREGLGVAILPRWSAEPYLRRRELRAVRLSEKGLHRRWRAVTRDPSRTPPFVQEFARLLAMHPITPMTAGESDIDVNPMAGAPNGDADTVTTGRAGPR